MLNIDAFQRTMPVISSLVDGYAELDSEWCGQNIKSPFSRLYYIKNGNAYITHKNTTIKMSSGNVYLIPAETVFSYKGCDKLLEKRFFHISIPTPEYVDLLSAFPGIYSLPIKSVHAENIFCEKQRDTYLYLLELKSIIYNTIVEFFLKYSFKKILINDYSSEVKKAIYYIQNNLNANLTLNDISDNSFISQSNLRKKFKEETGFTIGQYIDNLIFAKAKHLLLHSNISIKEISEALGFTEQFYFSRRFKEKNGITPSQYRKNNYFPL